jgi:hypothetical protein
VLDTNLKKALAAVGIAAAGALIIAKPENALMIILAAGGSVLVGYIAGWITDEIRNRNHDDDGFA